MFNIDVCIWVLQQTAVYIYGSIKHSSEKLTGQYDRLNLTLRKNWRFRAIFQKCCLFFVVPVGSHITVFLNSHQFVRETLANVPLQREVAVAEQELRNH